MKLTASRLIIEWSRIIISLLLIGGGFTRIGYKEVFSHVMMEPSRDAFNSILKLDLPSNRPFNLMTMRRYWSCQSACASLYLQWDAGVYSPAVFGQQYFTWHRSLLFWGMYRKSQSCHRLPIGKQRYVAWWCALLCRYVLSTLLFVCYRTIFGGHESCAFCWWRRSKNGWTLTW